MLQVMFAEKYVWKLPVCSSRESLSSSALTGDAEQGSPQPHCSCSSCQALAPATRASQQPQHPTRPVSWQSLSVSTPRHHLTNNTSKLRQFLLFPLQRNHHHSSLLQSKDTPNICSSQLADVDSSYTLPNIFILLRNLGPRLPQVCPRWLTSLGLLCPFARGLASPNTNKHLLLQFRHIPHLQKRHSVRPPPPNACPAPFTCAPIPPAISRLPTQAQGSSYKNHR